jgi:D-alanine-D-alanine ligase
MYPKLWEASGVTYPELIERLLELAMERHGTGAARSTEARELSS